MTGEYKFRSNGSHYNGGAVFFGYGYTAVGELRLSWIRKWFKKGERRGSYEDEFYVDGHKVADWAAALDAIKIPPVFTEEELEALHLIGDKPAQHREIDYLLRYSLHSKGAIEYVTPGNCRRTNVGRSALAKSRGL